MHQPAGLVARIEACATTGLVVLVMWAVLGCALGTVIPIDAYFRVWGLSTGTVNLLTAGAISMPILLWYVLGAVRHRATYGMRTRAIRFSGADGAELSRKRCAIRAIMAILTVPAWPVSCLLLLLTGRSLADLACGVAVVVAHGEKKGDSEGRATGD